MLFNYGEIIEVVDDITGLKDEGIIVFAERDEDYPMLIHIYLKHSNPEKNQITDPVVPEPFWKIITSSNSYKEDEE